MNCVAQSPEPIELPSQDRKRPSALEHLARAIWISQYSEANYFGVFTLYADGSGGVDIGATIVSGWLSEVRQWELFDADWRILLAQYDVPYFHMKEFAHSTGPFASWKGQENKRQNFMRKAIDAIANRVHRGFACIVDHSVFAQVDAEYMLSEKLGNPYCLAARTCIAESNRWLLASRRGIPVQYIFEEGDLGAGRLIDVINEHNAGAPPNMVMDVPTFKPSRDRANGTKGLTPLQAADFAAYEYLKAHRLGDDEEFYKYRKSFQALSRIPAIPGKYSYEDLVLLCNQGQIKKRA